MAAIWAWARLDIRLRWRSLVVLALLTMLAGTVTLAALAGARRADSALDRLLDVTAPATVTVRQLDPGFDPGAVSDLPYVEASGSLISGGLGELGEGISVDALHDTPTDTATLDRVERPVLLSGRLYRPDAADEAVVTQRFVDRWGKGVGDTVELRLPAPEQTSSLGDAEGGPLRGPTIRLRIVGVIRTPFFADWPGEVGTILPSPGVVAANAESAYGPGGLAESKTAQDLLVRLKGGAADVDRLRSDLVRIKGGADVDVQDLAGAYADREHSIAFEARALEALGVAAALASIVLVGQAIMRHVTAARPHLRTASAIGMTRVEIGMASSVGPVVACAVGGGLAIAGATLASGYFPIGTAAAAEPDPGLRVDLVVLAAGGVLMLIVAIAAAAAGAIAATAPIRPPSHRRRSAVSALLARVGAPLPVLVGSRLAFEPGTGPGEVPVRSTLVASVAAVLGLIAVAVVGSGVSDAATHPERFGQTLDIGYFTGFAGSEFIPTGRLESALVADDRVTGIATPRLAVATDGTGSASVALFSQEASELPVAPVVLSGRAPETATEVLLAPSSADDLHVAVGDTVSLTGSSGQAALRVVGIGLLTEGPRNRFDEGGLLTPSGFDRLFNGFEFRLLLLRLTGAAAADPAIEDELTSVALSRLPDYTDSGFQLGPVSDGLIVQQLEQVRSLPEVLGGFLVLLACGALGHALVTTVRRRRRDLATLRALGMTGAQIRSAVQVQALMVIGVGIVAGVPTGFALGETVWRSVASYTPLQHVAPTPMWAVLGIVPAAALVATLLAWLPGRRAARSRVADILRTE